MSAELEQMLNQDESDCREVQHNGVVTIPKPLREKHGIKKDDTVVIGEDENGEIKVLKV